MRHEWDVPPAWFGQPLPTGEIRVVAWARCARCGVFFGTCGDLSISPLVLPEQAKATLGGAAARLIQKLDTLDCAGAAVKETPS